jgi:hypothetical protein
MESQWAVHRFAAPWLVALGAALVMPAASAQSLPQTSEDVLQAMCRSAAVIFSGQVVAVRRHEGRNGSTGTVEIEFAVDDAVRGMQGARYILREWAGLWPAGDQPFQVGQRFLMLLHAPSAAGLSSPVDGMDGAIPIRAAGTGSAAADAPAPAASMAASSSASPSDARVVDLRWIQTQVVRPLSYRPDTIAHPISAFAPAHTNAVQTHPAATAETQSAPGLETLAPEVPTDDNATSPSLAQQSEPYTTVLTKLRAWVREADAPR